MCAKNDLYSKGEEIFNGVSHIVGAGLGVLFLIFFSVYGGLFLNGGETASLIIFSISAIILYTMSSIYHMLNPLKAKKIFRIFDHCTIYLLIAGTYTPMIVIGIPDVRGYTILGIVWTLAVVGITMNSINMNNKYVKITSHILYILMGWMIVFIFNDLIAMMNTVSLITLFVGGVLYTAGFVFYGLGKKKKWFHSIWHLFVLGGTIFHLVSLIFLII